MNTKHEKSPCCQVKIYKFGGKRRQCSLCKKTWTVWPKKQGRKSLRPNRSLLKKVLIKKQSLYAGEITHRNISEAGLSFRLKKSLNYYLSHSDDVKIPEGRLILVCDALWFQFKGAKWTMYVAIVRPINNCQAVILEPMLLPGRENLKDWKIYLNKIPDDVKNRIKSMVSDGFRGSDGIAKEESWIFQRCHFHLIAQLQLRRGNRKKLIDSPLREEIYQTILKLLYTVEDLQILKDHLITLAKKTNCPKKLKMISIDFLEHIQHFRNYINYPELNLPTTSNSVESLNKIIKSRCQHLRTPESLILRAKVLLKIRKVIICNPKNFQQN